jgi:hypothetical protein
MHEISLNSSRAYFLRVFENCRDRRQDQHVTLDIRANRNIFKNFMTRIFIDVDFHRNINKVTGGLYSSNKIADFLDNCGLTCKSVNLTQPFI